MPTPHRRAFRHAVDLSCSIVRERDFRLVADRAVDLSTDGMLVATDLPVLTGEPVIVSFRAPRSSRWIDAEAVVARVVHGRRPGERGRRLGLAFRDLGDEARHLLFRALRTLPPASPRSASRGLHPRRAEA
ncbi:MAG: PilZ domain-containing protein [Minicystis sp.]